MLPAPLAPTLPAPAPGLPAAPPAPPSTPPRTVSGNGSILLRASEQWWKRPADERYLSLGELYQATLARADASEAQVVPNLELEVCTDGDATGSPLVVSAPTAFGSRGEAEQLGLTDWTLGQLASFSKVPARTIKAFCGGVPGGSALMAVAMTQGLAHLAKSDQTQLYARTDRDDGQLMAITSPSYGRIYDHQVVRAIQEATDGGSWTIPAATYADRDPRRATTLYASDRDVFLFLVNEERKIEIQTPQGPRAYSRGFFAWNSEVGASTFGITTFLYDFVCDNRIVWGAQDVREFRIRHSKGGPERFQREGRRLLSDYAEQSGEKTRRQLQAAARHRAGKSEDEVLTFLQRFQYTQTESKKIVEQAKIEEGRADTVLDLVNGATALARGQSHTDARIVAERKASRMLTVAAG